MPLTPPTAEFVIPAQARIQAFDFQKRLESVPQSNSRLHGGLASADDDMKRPYPIDYFFRRPLRSSGHYNQHTSNRYGIGHLPPSACAGLLRHSRTGGNTGIGFSETLRICRTVQTPACASDLRQLMAIRSVLIRWIIFSDGLYNHRGTITNTRTINTALTTCRHQPAQVCLSFPRKRKSKHEHAAYTAHGRIRHSRAGGNPGIGFSETLRICCIIKLPPAGQACVS